MTNWDQTLCNGTNNYADTTVIQTTILLFHSYLNLKYGLFNRNKVRDIIQKSCELRPIPYTDLIIYRHKIQISRSSESRPIKMDSTFNSRDTIFYIFLRIFTRKH